MSFIYVKLDGLENEEFSYDDYIMLDYINGDQDKMQIHR